MVTSVLALRTCRKCGLEAHTEKDLDIFAKASPASNQRYGRKNLCKICYNEEERIRRRDPVFRAKAVARVKDWVARHPEHVREYRNQYYKEHREAARRSMRKSLWKLKMDVLSHYGGTPPKCACCGESYIEFMTIDHINGGGNKQRKELGTLGTFMYTWLRRNNYPEGYRVLCYNCNCAYFRSGYCPHQKKKMEFVQIAA